MPTLRRERLVAAFLYYDAAGRRRPPHAHHRPHRGARPRRGRSPTTRRSCGSHEGRAARVGGAARRGRRHDRRAGRAASSTPPACGPTTCAPSTRATTPTRSVRPRASTSPCRGTRCAPTSPPSSPCPRTGARSSSCRGATASTSAPPTPTTTARSTTRRAPPTTSTTCSAPSTSSSPSRSPTTTCSARGPGCARWSSAARSERTADLSRRHRWPRSRSGVVTVTGGKLTTYREMAADTVDEVVERSVGAAVAGRSRDQEAARCAAPTATTRSGDRRRLARPEAARAPGRPLRRRGPHACAAMIDADPTLGRAAGAGAALPAGRGGVRRALRDGPHPRRRARPPHPRPAAGARRGRRRRRRRRPRSSRPNWAGRRPSTVAPGRRRTAAATSNGRSRLRDRVEAGDRRDAANRRARRPRRSRSPSGERPRPRASTAPGRRRRRRASTGSRDVCADVTTDAATLRRGRPRLVAAGDGWALDGEVPALGRGGRPADVGRRGRRACSRVVQRRARAGHPAAGAAACAARACRPRRRRPRPHAGWPASSTSTTRRCSLDVRAGTFGDVLEDELRGRATSVTVGHWPQSMALSTVGGWLACRGAGQYSTRYGKIEDMVVGLEVVLADGRVIRTGGGARAGGRAPTSTSCSSAARARSASSPRPGCASTRRPPHERRAAYGFAIVRRRARRVPAHPAPGRHAGGAAALRRRESERNYDDRRRVHVLLVLDEGDAALVDADMAVVAEECAGADAARRRPRRPVARAPQRRRRRSRR